MSDTNAASSGTNAAAGGTPDPFRETIEIAVGPNPDGHDAQARAAHALAPDPAIVDDPEAPERSAPTPTQE